MKHLTKIFTIIFSIILIISSFFIILGSKPVMTAIGNLADINYIGYAFLWLILLIICYAIGISMFFIGIMLLKYINDIINDEK